MKVILLSAALFYGSLTVGTEWLLRPSQPQVTSTKSPAEQPSRAGPAQARVTDRPAPHPTAPPRAR